MNNPLSSDHIHFESMDRTNGNDLFFTHDLNRDHGISMYRFKHTSNHLLKQERVMIASANQIEYVIFDYDCNGHKAQGMQYSLRLNAAGDITDHDVRRYDPKTETFSGTIPKRELNQVSIPASALMIHNFGPMLNDAEQHEQTMIKMLNNGKNIAMSDMAGFAAPQSQHSLRVA